jgi:L-asparaginase
MTPVRILTTGGTLDKVHDWATETIRFGEDEKSQVPEILAQGRCDHPAVEALPPIDSLDMTDEYRADLLKRIEAAPETALVVTHGTSTMDVTARFLAGKIGEKTVVLTGAMRPHSLYVSDASFNLGGAVIAAQLLPAGVHAVMNGRVFAAEDIKKNERLGRFDR